MSGLWSLPKAAPVLLRHLGAYAELAALDVSRAQRSALSRMVASVAVVICFLFVILLACIGVIAYTWDTPNRLPAILWMCGGFLLLAIIAAIYSSGLTRDKLPFMAGVKEQWQHDRVLLDHLLSPEED